MKRICILDYGIGNTKSIINILESVSIPCILTNNKEEIVKSSHYILPGVGSYKDAIYQFKKIIPISTLENEIFKKKKPLMGICVGMQMMSTNGYEFEEVKGLNWIEGNVIKMKTKNSPLPHVGWNNVNFVQSSPIFDKIENNSDFYFLNSYCFQLKDKKFLVGNTNYDNEFNSAIQCNNLFGVQFHPEKSQRKGKKILENFFNLN
tara:strand:- start:1990 stop:2604 length:615 start_codon:yes stop_codon:yes gene_type:complete